MEYKKGFENIRGVKIYKKVKKKKAPQIEILIYYS